MVSLLSQANVYIGNGQSFLALLMVAVSFALGFALYYMFGFEDEEPAP